MSDAELDRLNERIMGLVQKGGRAYVSNATVNGRFALRACITNFRTTKADIDQTIEVIREAGRNPSTDYTDLTVRFKRTTITNSTSPPPSRARPAPRFSSNTKARSTSNKRSTKTTLNQSPRLISIANELIVSRLKHEFPDDGILAEESVDTKRRLEKSRVWMVDPLDGTNGFIDGNGDFAVQIGLAEDGECVLGVVYHPLTGTLYRAVRGEGCWIERPQFETQKRSSF